MTTKQYPKQQCPIIHPYFFRRSVPKTEFHRIVGIFYPVKCVRVCVKIVVQLTLENIMLIPGFTILLHGGPHKEKSSPDSSPPSWSKGAWSERGTGEKGVRHLTPWISHRV